MGLGRLLHLLGRQGGEAGPAQIGIGPTGCDLPALRVDHRQAVMAFREDRTLHGGAVRLRLPLGPGLGVMKAPQEKKQGQLLHHRLRVRDPARPHRIPDAVDLRLELTRDHGCPALPCAVWLPHLPSELYRNSDSWG